MVHWCSHRNQHVVNFEIPPFSYIRSVVHLLHLILIIGCFDVLDRYLCISVLSNLPEPLKPLRKRIVLVSNGKLLQEAQAGFAALTEDIATRPLCSLEFWGTDQLTP